MTTIMINNAKRLKGGMKMPLIEEHILENKRLGSTWYFTRW